MVSTSHSTLASRPVKEVYAVSRLVREARGVLEGSFPLLWVEGEISNLAMPASGHIYFTLKDQAAQVRCAMFKMKNRHLRFTPKNGMQVLLRVRVTLYEGRGEFQLVVEHMEEVGSGALQRAYEALKYRLGDEGLFDPTHKHALPTMPQSIGIISSPDGAAVYDILTALNRRFPAANVILYPVAVQGQTSTQQLVAAVELAEQRQECDVLIISRGGGSLEDLWSFNDEQLARAIFACSLPIISAVGHEVDFTIADFVADVRAATPSAAAEIAVPDSQQLLAKISSHCQRLSHLIRQNLQIESRHLKQLQHRLPKPKTTLQQQLAKLSQLNDRLQRSWSQTINNKRQQLDHWSIRLTHPQAKITAQQHKVTRLNQQLQHTMMQIIHYEDQRLNQLQQGLQLYSPLPTIKQQQATLAQLELRLNNVTRQSLDHYQRQLQQHIKTLATVSPLNTLARGYSITSAIDSGDIIRDVDQVELGESIHVRLHNGQLDCAIKKVHND